MTPLVLDGSHPGDPVAADLTAALTAVRPDAEVLILREQRIGNCAGDFYCWTKRPGMCNTDDDNRVIAARAARSDLLILLTPITFGGYSSALKRGVDHLIQNLSPMFTRIDGEVHHRRRYPDNPDLLVIGWTPEPDPQAEAVFRHLAHRHGRNTHARTVVCATVTGRPSAAELTASARDWLAAVARRESTPAAPADLVSQAHHGDPVSKAHHGEPVLQAHHGEPVPPGRAVLLVGSPRRGKSTSAALGTYLMEQLAQRGVTTETIQVYPTMGSAARRERALATLDDADLVVLAFPLYVDSLPAPTIAAMEHLAARRRGTRRPARFVAIANCGFPEPSHNRTALAICERFAAESGYQWGGGLALGGGEGIVHGTPLAQLGGQGRQVRAALELAAEDLAAGGQVSEPARRLLSRPLIPTWLYLLVGRYGWGRQARKHGVARSHLTDRPYVRTR